MLRKKSIKIINLCFMLIALSEGLVANASEIILCRPKAKECLARLEAGEVGQLVTIKGEGQKIITNLAKITKIENGVATLKVEPWPIIPILKDYLVVIHDDSGKSNAQNAASFSFSDDK